MNVLLRPISPVAVYLHYKETRYPIKTLIWVSQPTRANKVKPISHLGEEIDKKQKKNNC